MEFYSLQITHLNKETQNSISIAFKVPIELQEHFKFSAGQYVTLRAIINGEEIRRDYSLCSTPNSGIHKVVVKRVENGVFSEFANSNLRIGDFIEVSKPNGRFVFHPSQNIQRKIVAFAAGSGITPVMSILKTILEDEPTSSVSLVYGNKTPNDTIFLQEILALSKQFNNRFNLKLIYSQSSEEGALFGRIDHSIVSQNINTNGLADLYYICGPEAMINLVSETLVEKGISEDAIKYELFTVPLNKEEQEIVAVEGQSSVTVLVDDEETSFMMSQTKTILEAALENKVDAPYSCQGGICSSCIARLTEGEATMRQNNILTEGELAEGLILTCQAQPTTPNISIDYDDV